MSWLAKSIVNSLRGEEEEDDDEDEIDRESYSTEETSNERINQEEDDPARGVKDDLSELTQTLTRQFWGVASFLAPPPSNLPQPSDPTASDEQETLAGIRSDFEEISGRFKSGISMLSNTKAVSEISKIASTFLPFGSENEEEGEEEEERERKYEGDAVGVNDDVLAFARNISMHPETWLDFPLIPDEDGADDFDMSDAQQEHALAVEQYAPRLAALRMELCPGHMSERCFWKIYFVLLHSRLGRKDAEVLTTPPIMQAREMLLQDLQERKKPKSEASGGDTKALPDEIDASIPSEESIVSPLETSTEYSTTKTVTIEEPSSSVPINDLETEKHPTVPITDLETEKHPVETTEVKIIDKAVIEENPSDHFRIDNIKSDASNSVTIQKYEEDGDEWLKEEVADEASGSRGATTTQLEEEDVSFSDLEEDDEQGTSNNTKSIKFSGESTESLNKDSNDWLNIEDIDEE